MNDADDVQLQLKKKARRRLVGAIAFAAFAVLALPLVMNHEPPPPAQEVEFRIPGQNDAALAPLQPEAVVPPEPVAPEPQVQDQPQPQPPAQPATPAVTVRQITPPVSAPPTTTPRPAQSTPRPETPAADPEAQRAAAILAGKSPDVVASAAPAVPATTASRAGNAAANVPHVILIGAFSDEANVQNLKQKLTELRLPVYTETLDSPQGRKIRVRSGPFVSREAAEQALVKMQRIGVSGSVAPK
ncbi:MAG: SPOR domain-containing protein [Zoogloeaceae bacterium]|nr:SPOR domain-containing protein [Zoogloeaceae bacterium]